MTTTDEVREGNGMSEDTNYVLWSSASDLVSTASLLLAFGSPFPLFTALLPSNDEGNPKETRDVRKG